MERLTLFHDGFGQLQARRGDRVKAGRGARW
eukprot:CAMPEP_0181501576 /NCGR_PEP_ID=MMETSP1110-20121109/55868_1 /TAXON_ID=174948 /ORGANISM="Symbiodinium sp., Strain CCMP421" /LENGTH=30 /DNA_ID= /DNA_START= /DNA_END= /DNA_ORIENTATION=